MGTNYYLHPAPPKCDGCNECEGCGRPFEDQTPDRIHIGKSSHGWVWCWRGWSSGEACDCATCGSTHPALDNTQTWYEFLAQHVDVGGEIRDEYGHPPTFASLVVRIVNKRDGLVQSPDGPRWMDPRDKVVGKERVIFGEFS